jgi:hypothetical protein
LQITSGDQGEINANGRCDSEGFNLLGRRCEGDSDRGRQQSQQHQPARGGKGAEISGKKQRKEMKTLTERAGMPVVAVFCTGLAWIGLIGGVLLFIGGIYDSANPHVSGGVGEMTFGGALFFSSIIWFIAARAIALLAQIAQNTGRK